jgi:hypothetical protein
MPRDGLAICNALVGVVPGGSNQFPMRTFKTPKTANVKEGKWNDDEALSFETECAALRAILKPLLYRPVAWHRQATTAYGTRPGGSRHEAGCASRSRQYHP